VKVKQVVVGNGGSVSVELKLCSRKENNKRKVQTVYTGWIQYNGSWSGVTFTYIFLCTLAIFAQGIT